MSVWFTADLHIGHRLVAALRGFGTPDLPDPEVHDEAIFENWSRVVRRGDQVWVLGDLSVTGNHGRLADLLERIRTLPGEKHLIPGNHDACHPMHRDAHRYQPAYLSAFASVQAFARRRLNGADALMSHFPYTADRGETRYSQYRLPDEGKWLLHGHIHGAERRTSPREIHVGVDAWDLTPAPLEALVNIIQEGSA